jgi:hypothetical protein
MQEVTVRYFGTPYPKGLYAGENPLKDVVNLLSRSIYALFQPFLPHKPHGYCVFAFLNVCLT